MSFLRQVKFFDENSVWVFDGGGALLQKPANANAAFDPTPFLHGKFQSETRLVRVSEGMVAYRDISLIPGSVFARIALSIPSSLLLKDLAPAMNFFSLVLGIFLGEALAAFEIIYILRAGMLLEEYVANRSRRAIRKMLQLSVKDAHLLVNGKEIETPIEQLRRGDLVVVRTGEKIPADGDIEKGEADAQICHRT